MGKIYEGLKLDAERALYGERDAVIRRCVFDGPADGESALKECGGITAEDCDFHLRYPFWHVTDGLVQNCRMTETCRAALWYDRGMHVENSRLGGIKALLSGCEIESTEFGWFCRGLKITDCTLKSEYPFMQTRGMEIENLRMQGKYSFQYVENVTICNSVLDTKDAFWHGKNITVEDSVVKGEYLAWYSENLRLVRCKIIGTQPFCYAKNLVLEDCEMIDCDLAFENTTVEADVRGEILSVKNPAGGHNRRDPARRAPLAGSRVRDHRAYRQKGVSRAHWKTRRRRKRAASEKNGGRPLSVRMPPFAQAVLAGACGGHGRMCTSICGNGITMPFSSNAFFTPSLTSKNTSQ